MRITLNKKHSTKAERIFYEILKKNRIPFRFREKIEGREIDFIIERYAIEIDGHEQASARNQWLFRLGYVPLHYSNDALINNREKVEIQFLMKLNKKKLWD